MHAQLALQFTHYVHACTHVKCMYMQHDMLNSTTISKHTFVKGRVSTVENVMLYGMSW